MGDKLTDIPTVEDTVLEGPEIKVLDKYFPPTYSSTKENDTADYKNMFLKASIAIALYEFLSSPFLTNIISKVKILNNPSTIYAIKLIVAFLLTILLEFLF